jgi:hypothetical protein
MNRNTQKGETEMRKENQELVGFDVIEINKNDMIEGTYNFRADHFDGGMMEMMDVLVKFKLWMEERGHRNITTQVWK